MHVFVKKQKNKLLCEWAHLPQTLLFKGQLQLPEEAQGATKNPRKSIQVHSGKQPEQKNLTQRNN